MKLIKLGYRQSLLNSQVNYLNWMLTKSDKLAFRPMQKN